MRRAFISISIFACLSQCLHAQETDDQILEKYSSYKQNNPFEFSYLKTDKTIYFNGGKVKFCVGLLDQYLMPSQLSKIIYLELVHEANDYSKRFVFKAKNGVLNDEIILPMDIPTGNFELVAYTHFMRNFSLDDAAQRVPIYIQNTLEPVQRVAKAALPEIGQARPADEFEINIGETGSKVLFEVKSPFEQPMDAILVSEGYGSVQFTGRIKLKKGKTGIAIKKELFRGNFQKVILLDKNLNVLTVRAYYLHASGGPKPYNQTEHLSKLGEKESFLGKIGSINELGNDSLHMFRRIYQLYYKVPPDVDISHLSFNELTSQTILENYSDQIKGEWTGIIKNNAPVRSIDYTPEKNLHLRGSITGDLDKLDGAIVAVHFFNDHLDMIAPLTSSGFFDIEIALEIRDNAFIASILNAKKEDVSNDYSISIEYLDPISYSSQKVDYYPASLTDSLIASQMEFNYILSTFNEIEESNSFLKEIEETEKKVPVADYRNITSFEDFIREAVIDVTVVKRNGNRSLNIYNPIKRMFDAPQMIILNDIVLEESLPLFDLPIEILESVNPIMDRDDLYDLGFAFTGGILRVVTSQPIDIPADYLDDKFGTISGFYYSPEKNQVAAQFNPSNLLHLVSGDEIKPLNDQMDEDIHMEPSIELIQSDGTYHFIYDLKK